MHELIHINSHYKIRQNLLSNKNPFLCTDIFFPSGDKMWFSCWKSTKQKLMLCVFYIFRFNLFNYSEIIVNGRKSSSSRLNHHRGSEFALEGKQQKWKNAVIQFYVCFKLCLTNCSYAENNHKLHFSRTMNKDPALQTPYWLHVVRWLQSKPSSRLLCVYS